MRLGLFATPCHPPHQRHSDTFDDDPDLLTRGQAWERTKYIKLGIGVGASC
jgi:hypothetical protein